MLFADNLKAALVAAVIVGHVTIAWIGFGGWRCPNGWCATRC